MTKVVLYPLSSAFQSSLLPSQRNLWIELLYRMTGPTKTAYVKLHETIHSVTFCEI